MDDSVGYDGLTFRQMGRTIYLRMIIIYTPFQGPEIYHPDICT